MEEIFDYLKKHLIIIIIAILLIVVVIFQIIIMNKDENKEVYQEKSSVSTIALEQEKNIENKLIKVDIKGAIKKPGIYEMNENQTISDVIKTSGGLLKNATTLDINLSKIVYNEMVIYISTKDEYNKRRIKKTCNCSLNDDNKDNLIDKTKENLTINPAYDMASSDTFVKDYNNATANESILPNNPIKDDKNDNSIAGDNNANEERKQIDNQLININTASKDDLQKIPGIGASKADKIVEYRNTNLFKSIEDIKNVSGIGNSLYDKIKDHITI